MRFANPVVFLTITLAFATTTLANETDVPLRGEDGALLGATYFDPGQSGPGLLLLHQCQGGATRGDWTNTARVLQKSGFHVVTLDWRGYGDSQGTVPTGNSLEEFLAAIRDAWHSDLELALAKLQSMPNVEADRIGTMGSSCGMLMSLGLSENHPEVLAQVLVTGPVDDVALDQLAKISIPTLGLLGRDDPSMKFMERIEDITVPRKGRMLFVPEGAGHGAEIFDNVPELPAMIAAWFQFHLNGSRQPD
jgi:alpha-beta hydrolase superfamily lysophospholipase